VEARQRKKLHNQIEDMKGAIRVFCRIRPLSSTELARGNIDITEYLSDKCTLQVYHPIENGSGGMEKGPKDRARSFTFDSVFSPQDGQDSVFEDVSHLIQSASDGYNVCIFAYGQTGSGKTWTMSGIRSNPGVQPRAVEEIFSIVKRDQGKFDYKISVYMVEMYLDGLNDLLKGLPGGETLGKLDRKGNLKVSKDTRGRVVVGGVTQMFATTAEDMANILSAGQAKRHVSATKMNSESSRSHLVSSIMIEATDKKTKLTTTGKLTLVDLAGSESQKKTGASGDQLKEAKAINSSLSALGNVISALTSNQKHIPYRDSKLTELLQDGERKAYERTC
jgi:hypothetical protein